MVAIKRQPAFASACPRVGSARIKTVSAAEEGASSWSQKLVSSDIVTAIHRRTAKPQELTGSPARRNANGVAAGSADVARCSPIRTGNRIAIVLARLSSKRSISRALRAGRCSLFVPGLADGDVDSSRTTGYLAKLRDILPYLEAPWIVSKLCRSRWLWRKPAASRPHPGVRKRPLPP